MLADLAEAGRRPGEKGRCPALLPGPHWPAGSGWREGPGRGGAGRKAEPAWRAGQGCGAPWVLEVRGRSPSGWWLGLGLWTGGEGREVRPHELGRKWGWGLLEEGGRRRGSPRDPWDKERRRGRRGLEPPATAPRGFLQVSPEGAGDEDSCSSSAPLSPSSSPRSMASGSVCPPGKCVCNSCGLEIVDKYLLKVGRRRQAPERVPWEPWEKGNVYLFPLFHSHSPLRW